MIDLRSIAREIFMAALTSIDARRAVRRAARLDGPSLSILDTTFNLDARPSGIYSIALGKAALPMAVALDELLKDKIRTGVVSCALAGVSSAFNLSTGPSSFSSRWHIYEGGHPLPNEASLAAARTSFDLLRRADDERAIIIFLISGGGSAMIEWPRDEETTLEDLRAANRTLVNCGANIAEINAVRRAFSAVKGGGLSRRAPHASQVSLIISDTNAGDETNVASGPSFDPPADAPDAREIIARYALAARLPERIVRAVHQPSAASTKTTAQAERAYYVLLDNESAIEAARAAAQARGLIVELASDLIEQPVDEGSAELVARLAQMRRRHARKDGIVCLISGGEFACQVHGAGTGGRNAETVLRCLLEMDQRQTLQGVERVLESFAILSAGTDGIDGNSPAAGAVADHTTLMRANSLGLDARRFLDASDAYNFFNALSDAVITGPTGTNVRDLRIMLMS